MHKAKALKIYLFLNCFSVVFMVFILAYLFNIPGVNFVRGNTFWIVVLPYVVAANIINGYAKKVGKGLLNPIRTNKKAVGFKYASLAFFFGGILLANFVDRSYVFVSSVAIPLEVIKVYVAHKEFGEDKETGLIDDFELKDD